MKRQVSLMLLYTFLDFELSLCATWCSWIGLHRHACSLEYHIADSDCLREVKLRSARVMVSGPVSAFTHRRWLNGILSTGRLSTAEAGRRDPYHARGRR